MTDSATFSLRMGKLKKFYFGEYWLTNHRYDVLIAFYFSFVLNAYPIEDKNIFPTFTLTRQVGLQ